jgi:hypothetical protein
MPLTGLPLTIFGSAPLELYTWTVPLCATTDEAIGMLRPALHEYVLPYLCSPSLPCILAPC